MIAPSSIGFDHPVIARRIDVDDADVAELAVDIADPRDRGAVVRRAAHQNDVTRPEMLRGAVPVERIIHKRVVVVPVNPRSR